MAEQADPITEDQKSLDKEQQVTSQEPRFVSEDDFNRMRRDLEGQVRGLQGKVDKAEHALSQINRQREIEESQTRIAELERERDNTGTNTALYNSQIAQERARQEQISRQPEQTSPQQDPQNTRIRELLEMWGVDPSLEGIDWSQDVNSQAGLDSFMKSVFEARDAATRKYFEQRQARTPEQQQTVDPPVMGGGAGNGVITNNQDNYQALVEGRITRTQFRENEAKFR